MAKAVMGRPKKKLDQVRFEELCACFCTAEDVAGEFDCSVDALQRWVKDTYGPEVTFGAIFKKKSASGRNSLRSRQFKLAMDGNVGMLIWLGKQYLDQSDKAEVKQTDKREMSEAERSLLVDFAKKSEEFFREKKNE